MQIDTNPNYLPVYEALASKVRLQVIELIRDNQMNVKELAQACGISSAIMSMHVKKLEQAGLIESVMKRRNGGTYKYCSLAVGSIQVDLRGRERGTRLYETSVQIGHYTNYQALPTCGIATKDKNIGGKYDDPRSFLDPERVNAQILWFTKGFVEYKIPNYIREPEQIQEIEISMEISSEAPKVNENWPSDIAFRLNGTKLGYWTCPGDYGLTRGKLTPAWWPDEVNQYGLLKKLKVRADGTYLDDECISDVGIGDIPFDSNQWTFQIEVSEDRIPAGGLTLFGRGFGNYEQDIAFRVVYMPLE